MPSTHPPARLAALLLIVFGPLAWLLFGHGQPIPQDPGYHLFADGRSCLGIANFGNVGSNLAFLATGLAGLFAARRAGGARLSWQAFFTGVALVSAGSAWYHLKPSDATLFWDRLPMTLAFMALFSALLTEHLGPAMEKRLLPAAAAVGGASLIWWLMSGDLRIYLWVQAAPLLAVPYLLAAFPPRYTQRLWLLWGVCLYALAKVAEVRDYEIYAWSGMTVSGHTLKHLLAAAAAYCVVVMLKRRQSLTPVASSQ
ncbi:MAG: ceramidase domain-containing protein [Betaproteobacteria bacterium]